ncbi:hypothetical protein [Candidatus Sodalis sp. SoCistrobi]|uniref:hypothetical protein n=1 Tax=Candidatus Sodalis sp. SoCistrobi TaxID=1922216 RepID=UPI00093AB23F|nr:hypothetical protein [Candidatus Sodalis sp. SoCistrobi]
MTEITHSYQGGAPTRIRLTPGLTDPDFMTVGLAARKSEREHLLGMLSAFLESQRARAVPADKILDALNDWIALRLSTLDMTKESPR